MRLKGGIICQVAGQRDLFKRGVYGWIFTRPGAVHRRTTMATVIQHYQDQSVRFCGAKGIKIYSAAVDINGIHNVFDFLAKLFPGAEELHRNKNQIHNARELSFYPVSVQYSSVSLYFPMVSTTAANEHLNGNDKPE